MMIVVQIHKVHFALINIAILLLLIWAFLSKLGDYCYKFYYIIYNDIKINNTFNEIIECTIIKEFVNPLIDSLFINCS